VLARCLGIGTGIGLLAGLLAGPGTDTATGAVLLVLGGVLGCALGALTAVALDVAGVELPPLRLPARPVEAPVRATEPVEEDDLGPLVPAGWYPDPRGGGSARYWDGESWA